MKTTYYVLDILGRPREQSVDWPRDPGSDRIKALVQPLLKGGNPDHVTVLHNGERGDMFVDDKGQEKQLARNIKATRIYRAATLARAPQTDPESLPWIWGIAILFDRVVWY